MSLMTTWTSSTATAARRGVPEQRAELRGPRPAWDCANCSMLNPGARKRCTDCGTTRD